MLKKSVFTPIPGNSIKPLGWLRRQLEIQAQGLSGHLDLVWPDVSQSRWIGGDKEGWERVPYWLDGFIPLAWLLDDASLQARARRYMDAILEKQQEDGWICPCSLEERKRYDTWALFLIAKVMTVYADLSGDERIVPALYRALRQFDAHIDRATLFNWSAARWYECLIPIFWLYEKQPEPWLLKLAHKLRAEGIDYAKLFDNYLDQEPEAKWTYLTHVVNLAMCLKQEALVSRMTGGDPDAYAKKALQTLFTYHGMAVGHFTGDECVSGDSPIQGSELCSVVEAMYSYEVLLSAGGNPFWADQLERLAFNALPATVSPDMWTHQYVQMTNQVQCAPLEEDQTLFRTNGPDSHIFGLEPNFGCCTANFNQGFPKFALSTFMRTEDGLVSAVLAPSTVKTSIGQAQVTCTLHTDYPFRNTLRYTLETDRPVTFPFMIRIPGFAKSAKVDGQNVPVNGYHTITREWSGRTEIDVVFAFDFDVVKRPQNMACLWRGPLLYALPIKERWEKREYEENGVPRKFPYCDYDIYPESPWNYGFAGDDFTVAQREMGAYPFSPEGAAIAVTAPLAKVDWPMEHGACTRLPKGNKAICPSEKMVMIPYGCTNLRMTEMPLIQE